MPYETVSYNAIINVFGRELKDHVLAKLRSESKFNINIY